MVAQILVVTLPLEMHLQKQNNGQENSAEFEKLKRQ